MGSLVVSSPKVPLLSVSGTEALESWFNATVSLYVRVVVESCFDSCIRDNQLTDV